MESSSGASRKTLQEFIDAHVEQGTAVECDGFQAYPGLKNVAVDAKVYDCASGDLKWLHKALSNLKAFLTGTYHGRCEQLQSYLDEYCFHGEDWGMEELLPIVMKVGQVNLKCMALLHKANTETYGHPVPTTVPLTLVLSWYEQKAVCILLTLLHLGIKNIYLGPTLPAFLSAGVAAYLVQNFDIHPTTTPEQDWKAILG